MQCRIRCRQMRYWISYFSRQNNKWFEIVKTTHYIKQTTFVTQLMPSSSYLKKLRFKSRTTCTMTFFSLLLTNYMWFGRRLVWLALIPHLISKTSTNENHEDTYGPITFVVHAKTSVFYLYICLKMNLWDWDKLSDKLQWLLIIIFVVIRNKKVFRCQA